MRVLKNTKGTPYEVFWYCEMKFFAGKSWYSLYGSGKFLQPTDGQRWLLAVLGLFVFFEDVKTHEEMYILQRTLRRVTWTSSHCFPHSCLKMVVSILIWKTFAKKLSKVIRLLKKQTIETIWERRLFRKTIKLNRMVLKETTGANCQNPYRLRFWQMTFFNLYFC